VVRKLWLVVGLLAGLLAVGLTSSAVFAQGGGTGTSPTQTLLARVASKLGIDQAKLEQAFVEAAKELQTEALKQRLDKAVQAGRLTQEQADAYLKWYQSRPNLPSDGLRLPGFHGPRGFHGPGPGGMRKQAPAPSQGTPTPAPKSSGGTSA